MEGMTQKNKQLLLQDLCARFPYGLKVKIKYYDTVWNLRAIYTSGSIYAMNDVGYTIDAYFEDCKPYLFPLSSMTEEQYNEFFSYYHNIEMNEIKMSGDYLKAAYLGENAKHDWLNKNHFDYRYLIDRNLAIDCTSLNIY